jgi:formaldehyde dismutase / methanol dehydrogenase
MAACERARSRDLDRTGSLTARSGRCPTKFYENAAVIKGDDSDVDRITNHVLGDACTPGNAKECTFETVRPVVEHCMNGDLDDLLS